MDLINRVQTNFYDNISLKEEVAKTLTSFIVDAAQVLVGCIRGGGKILSCGNGGSACDALHFNTEMTNRFMLERDGLPAVALVPDTALLTAIANDYDYQDVFSRQIKALGKKHDVLLAITTSGNSGNIVQAIIEAQRLGMQVIALTGKNGGDVSKVLDASNIEIRVPSEVTPRIQEVHILVIHSLCELVDYLLFEKSGEEV